MGNYNRLLIELLNSRADHDKPDASDVYAAGSLIGLDMNDIRRLYRRSASSKLELLVTKYWYVLLPIGILIDVIILLILSQLPPGGPSDIYPRADPGGLLRPMYGVPAPGHYKKRYLPPKT